jgi:hypothetical protein
MKIAGISIAALIGVLALVWLIQGNDFFMYQFFAPKYENVRREVFENTQSYVESKRQDLVKYRLEYMRAKTDEEKAALKFTIVQEFANFDETKLPSPELRDFLRQMKYE